MGRLLAWKEKAAFLAALAALAAYGADWALSSAARTTRRASEGPAEQRYVVSSRFEPLPAGGSAVFASAEESAYWAESARRVWVQPKIERQRQEVRLELPSPTVPAPPMLLTIPGPALEFTSALPRWPAFPVAARAAPAAEGGGTR